MNAENFCYWLNGYFEIAKVDMVSESSLIEIKNHLELVLSQPSGLSVPFYNYFDGTQWIGTQWIGKDSPMMIC